MQKQTTPQTVLITGATSGIGLALARRFARDKYNLVIIARNEAELQTVKAGLEHEFGIAVTAMAKDLSLPNSAIEIYEQVNGRGTVIDVLVNNAGYAEHGLFQDISLERELQLMQVNMISLTALTKLFLTPMIERRRGRILNVASTAGFMPGGPLMTVYYASKAYVRSFTESLAPELKGTGVTASVFCPGPTKTKFEERANMKESALFKSRHVMDVETVADAGYAGLMRGKTVIVPGLANKLSVQVVRLLPRKLIPFALRRLHSKQ